MPQKEFLVFIVETGAIVRVGDCPDTELDNQAGEGEAVLAGTADMATEHVVASEVSPRPAASWSADKTSFAADGVDEVMVSGALNGAAYWVRKQDGELVGRGLIIGGAFSFTTTDPGVYEITIEAFPELKTTVQVTAT